MMSNDTSIGHLDDAELVRYMDAESTEHERRRLERHLARCRSCAHELDAFRDRSRSVRLWLDAASDPTAPIPAANAGHGRGSRRSIPAWWKAAAAVVLVAAPLAAIPPVRGWVADRLPVTVGPAAPAAPSADHPAVGSVVRFAPDPGALTVIIEARQAGGTLTLGRVPGSEAVLEVVTDDRAPTPVVSARGVRIENGAGATASYRLRVPATVTALSVRIADTAFHVTAAELARGLVVPLDRPVPGRAGSAP